MWRKILPKTVVGQLMTTLIVVLLVAQFLNLVLLVGAQRLQARSNTFNQAIEFSAILLERLPDELPSDLPLIIRPLRGELQGAYFVSDENRALAREEAKPLPRYNARLFGQIKTDRLKPLQSFVTYLPHVPNSDREVAARRLETEQDLLRASRPFRGRDEARGRPPPPPRLPGSGRGETNRYKGPVRPNGRPLLSDEERRNQQEIRISVEIKSGVWFNAMIPHRPTEALTGRIFLATALLLGLTILAGWVFAKRISRPLTDFTRAAERLGRGETPEVLQESGPDDIRLAASAFNRMQSRLTRTLETQRTMLRAVGHDLRTPLTSLRLRAEYIPDNLGKEKFISTIDDMTFMTEEILNWAKDASATEDLASVDLEAMLASLVDDYQDQGHDVSLVDFKTVTVRIRRIAIKRALQNLINNALDYGVKAEVSVMKNENRILIHIDDNGAGVPEAKLSEMVKPFVRLESSRNKSTGGTGLGLSIVESIAQLHGGQLILQNNVPKGLRASLSLPL